MRKSRLFAAHEVAIQVNQNDERVMDLALENPNLTLLACANRQADQCKAEGKPVKLLSETKVTPRARCV